MSDNLKKYILFGIIGILLVCLGFWIIPSGDSLSRISGDSEESTAERMAKTNDPTRGDSMSDNEDSSPFSGDPINDGVTPSTMVKLYKEWAQFPPNSRPMSILNHDLAFPFIVESSPDYLFNNVGDKEPNGYVCLFQPRSWAVIGSDEKMVITLECRDDKRSRVKLTVNSHQVFREFDGERHGVASADVGDNGENGDEVSGDNIWTFQWRPMKQDWGEMSVVADIAYAGCPRARLGVQLCRENGTKNQVS